MVSDTSSYNIYRSESQTGTYSKVGTSTSPSYVDTVARTGTYYYKISAVSASGFESVYSAPTAVVVTGPSVPTNVTASATDDQVTVSWNVVTESSSYNIYRSDNQTETYTKVGTSTSLPYTETVGAMGTYYYEVSSVGASGFESAHSTSTAVTVITTPKIDVIDLSETLSWLAANAVNSTHYTLSLTRDETIPAQTLSYSGKDVTITLKGKDGERMVSLSDNGSLFTVAGGVTLVLEDGVTLKGRSNNASLITVNLGGTLLLKDGAKITGNTASFSGGVYVRYGTFTMSGGEISGNTAFSSSAYGGGVVVSSGRFTMSGGTISGNRASSSSSYDPSSSRNSYGGGVYVYDGTFTMSGGAISGNTASSYFSSSSSYGGGVYVDDGTLR